MDPAARRRLTLVATILGSSIAFIDTSVVNVALPALRRDLGAGLAGQQWVVEAYLLTLGSLLLVGGTLADGLGRRRVFKAGLVAFAITSVACAVAPSIEVLIAARAVQGAAAALLVPVSLAIIAATFTGTDRGAAVGSWTAWTGIAIVIGPLLGGALVELISWRVIFAVNLPIVAVTLILVSRAVEESRDPDASGSIDSLGASLVALGLGGVVVGLIEESRRGLGDLLVWAPIVVGVLALVAFLVREHTAREPMLPLGLFRIRNFAAANAATLVIYGALGGLTFFGTIYFQQVADYSALEAGLAFAPITVILFLLSRRFGALASRAGPRVLMTVGPLVAAAGAALFVRVGRDPSYLSDVLPAVVLFGLGLAMTVAPLTATVLDSVEERQAGIASGVNNAIARVAGLLAIAAVGAVAAAQFGSSVDQRVDREALSPGGRVALSEARERSLTKRAADAPAAERPELEAALAAASESAFDAIAWTVALLLAAGGGIAAAGVRGGRAPPAEPAVA